MDVTLVHLRYARTFLALDVIAALPYVLIHVLVCNTVWGPDDRPGSSAGNCSARGVLLLRLFGLLNLAVLPRLLNYLSKWQVGGGARMHHHAVLCCAVLRCEVYHICI